MEVNMDSAEIYQFIAQGIGVVACGVQLISYQCKTQKNIMMLLVVSQILFSINFLMLGMISGMLLNVIGMVRALIYTQRNEHKWAASFVWVFVFIPLVIVSGIISATVFNGGWIAFLPVGGMIITTFAGRCEKASNVRLLTLVNSPFWLIYNIIGGAIGPIIGEIAGSTSILIAMFRLDIKKKSDEGFEK